MDQRFLSFNSKKLSAIFKKAREAKGYTLADAAMALGFCSESHLCFAEKNGSFSLTKINKAATLYELDKKKIVELLLKETRDRLEKEIG